MMPRTSFRVTTLFLAIFCPLTASAAVSGWRKDVTIDAPVTRSSDELRTLWKRRRGDSSGSDSDSDSGSSSGGYGYDDSTSLVKHTAKDICTFTLCGIGKKQASKAAIPQGSGTPLSWDNSSGSWISLDFLWSPVSMIPPTSPTSASNPKYFSTSPTTQTWAPSHFTFSGA
ncbi:predicted protein [Aspergillus nidulans FGSC A4]|uniref:Uncharacterized protein n=1 Tax=Emericella nidulans (strain FGSC A4 / ATCC 38163 / CBS 112.46 / NRRL 194 / M139) TaxID=227321 RepID=Q5AS08_EMENI|nr:hypothetical protein [Aspergillus nidulans FGSC A4]EAA64056.1 predicted protein [Aspergillus nidulans FGSC A4]CBF84653.1 TPA: hypothetical protein ANIA_08922 [Aspergillus nidulans FGSC A4]|eukprot:XP_682191.1 predicted protein [Aspergillus nidulans FGSC A4]